MSVETTVYSTLANDAGVTALVSTRIYPSLAPESAALPVVVYQLIGGEPISTLPGVSNTRRKNIQLECHATTYAGSVALGNAVIAALEGNGYQNSEYDLYDPQTQVHSRFIGWDFLEL